MTEKRARRLIKNVKINDWNKVGKASVRYLSREKIRVAEIGRLIDEVCPDSIYLNSFFSTFTVFIMVLRRFGRTKNCPVIVAPQGELSDGALSFKKRKKGGYLKLSKGLDLYRNIVWKTSSEFEAVEAMAKKGSGGTILIAPDMPPRSILPDYRHDEKNVKTAGAARFVFLSRIHPKKNLLFLLEILGNLTGDVLLDVLRPC
jgi:glycosyltransferase involved in cell wall biosynthesis